MFSKILIANRGEIALRVARSARALGYPTVAVYSDADAGAPHARGMDEAVGLGGVSPRESYLDIGKILAAAKATGADAIHPGYGFLSENEDFAEACAAAGVTFIGPPPAAIRAMGLKAASKALMEAAGVPLIPGYHGADQDPAKLAAEAGRIGYPVLIKASAGGGGKGMRAVDTAEDFAAALASCQREARSAFGDDAVLIEKYVKKPRHVEIQVFADRNGQVIHLGERDCSVQRRHQKVIEEAPSPAVDADLRARMGEAACAAARAIGYVGAGTVEFLVDADGQFYFMEMNTRLQVEHPVTELITGLDLVAWQIRVARGEPLPLTQDEVRLTGHAIEVRLYAEDARAGFLPQTGTLLRWRPPAAARCDHALADGTVVTPHYDPMLAKIICWGETRDEARRRLIGALRDTVALGVTTNRDFLIGCLEHPEFFAGRATTDFIAAHFAPETDVPPAREAIAAAAWLLLARAAARLPQPALAGWASSGLPRYHLSLATPCGRIEAGIVAVGLAGDAPAGGGAIDVDCDLGPVAARQIEADGEFIRLEMDGVRHRLAYAFDADGRLHLDVGGRDWIATDADREPPVAATGAASGSVTPPMHGRLVALPVAIGDAVRRGQPVAVIESMKMEQSLPAPCDGTVAEIGAQVGDQVGPGKLLVRIDPADRAGQKD